MIEIGPTEFLSIRVFPTTDKTLPAFDNTKLVAINTCPTFGIVRYSEHKTMGGNGRAMALEAGGAAHEVFAAHRLFHALSNQEHYATLSHAVPNLDALISDEGARIFGAERFNAMASKLSPDEDSRQNMLAFSLEALNTSGFYDDPGDRRRTMTNIEEMCIAYMDHYSWDDQLPALINMGGTVRLGIEIPMDVTIEYTLLDGTVKQYRLTGKADGIHYGARNSPVLRVHENKTASRLGDAWEQSFDMAHQPTGYMIGMSTLTESPINEAVVLGSCLPLPRSVSIGGLSRVVVRRDEHMIREWFDWFYHTVSIHDAYIDDPANAPHYTHSCNRYFRPCSMIPFCASTIEDRRIMLEEMEIEEWSPLEPESNDE